MQTCSGMEQTVITNAAKAQERKERRESALAQVERCSTVLSRTQLQAMTGAEVFAALGVRPRDLGDGEHNGTNDALDACCPTAVDLIPWGSDIEVEAANENLDADEAGM